jgi:hypothetical protein
MLTGPDPVDTLLSSQFSILGRAPTGRNSEDKPENTFGKLHEAEVVLAPIWMVAEACRRIVAPNRTITAGVRSKGGIMRSATGAKPLSVQ